jgi:hypothetical protein
MEKPFPTSEKGFSPGRKTASGGEKAGSRRLKPVLQPENPFLSLKQTRIEAVRAGQALSGGLTPEFEVFYESGRFCLFGKNFPPSGNFHSLNACTLINKD